MSKGIRDEKRERMLSSEESRGGGLEAGVRERKREREGKGERERQREKERERDRSCVLMNFILAQWHAKL